MEELGQPFSDKLTLDRCPHCSVAKPNLVKQSVFDTRSYDSHVARRWGAFYCTSCGGVVIAGAKKNASTGQYLVMEIYPKPRGVDSSLPDKVGSLLSQANDSLHAPAGAVMLAASAVDAMLKIKGYENDKKSLKQRIDAAANDNLITGDMKLWAHDIRLGANEQRHADKDADLPSQEEARRVIDFAFALGELLFVLPARVRSGREEASNASSKSDEP